MAAAAGQLGAEDLQVASFLAAGPRSIGDRPSTQQQGPEHSDQLQDEAVAASEQQRSQLERQEPQPYVPVFPVNVEVGAKVYHQNIGKGIGLIMSFESYTDDGYRRWKVTWANGGPKERPCSDRYMQAVIVENPCQPSGYQQPCICIRGKHYGRRGLAISKIPESNWWNVDFEPSTNPRLVDSTAVPGENLHCTAYAGDPQPPVQPPRDASQEAVTDGLGLHTSLLQGVPCGDEVLEHDQSLGAAIAAAAEAIPVAGSTGLHGDTGPAQDGVHILPGSAPQCLQDDAEDKGHASRSNPVPAAVPGGEAVPASHAAPESHMDVHETSPAMISGMGMGTPGAAAAAGPSAAKNVAAARQRAAGAILQPAGPTNTVSNATMAGPEFPGGTV